MADKRSYRDLVIRLETQNEYINNHLHNIDSHLNRLNERTSENELNTAKNTNSIKILRNIRYIPPYLKKLLILS